MSMMITTLRLRCLLGATALTIIAPAVWAQDLASCAPIGGPVPPYCDAPNRDTVVSVPAGKNTERGVVTVAPEGFAISIDGRPVTGDARVVDKARAADRALEAADLRVTFDGLGTKPRLDLQTVGDNRVYHAGDAVTFQSAVNYPAFLARGDIRILDLSARGGPRTVAVVPVAPNGLVSVTLPDGEELVAVHRVYDRLGRYDETAPLPLSRRDDRGLTDGVEEGNDSAALRNIPISGGAVTVSGRGLAGGARVETLGEVVKAAPGGDFVIQRILPAGSHAVDVTVEGGGLPLSITREIEIPATEWFTVATADLTFGWTRAGGRTTDWQRGRLGFYTKGKTAGGMTVTASADTGEGDLQDLFRDLDKKDPRSLILRIDPDDYYPVYGDDSTIEEDAPTSGKFYLKVEKDGNYALWGNFKNDIRGGEYMRNERTLYGAQLKWASAAHSGQGDARTSVTAYAASPDNLPGRDIFRGTGGSVYFLKRQDISIGSETLTIEIRDPDTGRVIDRQRLTYGRDYDINYIQGVVTLRRPLSGSVGTGVVSGADDQVNLVAQYEYTPTATDVSGMAYGARAETWVTDQLRFGVTGMVETTDVADQTAWGADLLWRLSEDTQLEVEYARSDGPGFGSSYSSDGGLIVNDNAATAGTGEALRIEGRVGLRDAGVDMDGFVGAYAERRAAGFSSLDYQVSDDETLWGVFGEVSPSERLRFNLAYDDYKNAAGKVVREGEAEADYKVSERLGLTFGLKHTDKVTTTETGRRTDVALRATVTQSERLEWYVFGQATLDRSGLGRNDRLGFGGTADLGRNWTLEGEISDGTSGLGGKALFTWAKNENDSLYFGYELDQDRDLNDTSLTGRDKGQFVAGGRRQITSSVSTFAENTYDLFGDRRTLASSYGVDYAPDDFLTYTTTVEIGRVQDESDGNFDRKALSFGVNYQDDERLTARGRLEYRRDRGTTAGTNRDADTLIVKATARYKIDEEKRLSFNLDAASTQTDQSSVLDGDLVDASVGYAYRPIENDRLNLLLKYRFVYDMYGQRVNGTDDPGPRQKSHVFSVDAEYDVNRFWTVGGKLGFRLSDTSPNATTPFSQNDAWLVVANARLHVVHNWDALVEVRALGAEQAGTTNYGLLAAVYRQMGNNLSVGVGYNFGRFSDDLTDLVQDDQGLFLNIVAKF